MVTETPKEQDVLLGRSHGSVRHPGNIRLKQFVEDKIEEYKFCSRSRKTEMVCAVVEDINIRGGTFLKHDPITGLWLEVDEKHAKEKVGHAFRDAAVARFGSKRINKRRLLRALKKNKALGTHASVGVLPSSGASSGRSTPCSSSEDMVLTKPTSMIGNPTGLSSLDENAEILRLTQSITKAAQFPLQISGDLQARPDLILNARHQVGTNSSPPLVHSSVISVESSLAHRSCEMEQRKPQTPTTSQQQEGAHNRPHAGVAKNMKLGDLMKQNKTLWAWEKQRYRSSFLLRENGESSEKSRISVTSAIAPRGSVQRRSFSRAGHDSSAQLSSFSSTFSAIEPSGFSGGLFDDIDLDEISEILIDL